MEEIQFRYSFACQFVADKNVIEIGFGAGYGVVDIAARADKYLGIDLLEVNRMLAKERLVDANLLDRANVVCGEATEIPVAATSADILIAFAMIYYVDVSKFFCEVNRVLKPDGRFVFCQTNPLAINFSPSRNTIAYYSRTEINHLLREQGFSCEIYGIPELDNSRSKKTSIMKKIKGFFKNWASGLYSYIRRRLTKYDYLPEKILLSETAPMLDKLRLVTKENEERVRILFVVATKMKSE